jgi:hypothetical protein
MRSLGGVIREEAFAEDIAEVSRTLMYGDALSHKI